MDQLINYTAQVSTHNYVAGGARYSFTIYPEFHAEQGEDGPELEETGNKIVVAITPNQGTLTLTLYKQGGRWVPMFVEQREQVFLPDQINQVLIGSSVMN